ncbi:MAG TPA: acyl-CoA dehydrogenase family protein [Pseudonocardiaceae bacterium]|nr:acyl-CoA dehydrogenase family protein [Pseudonocardiaceae bacterium]
MGSDVRQAVAALLDTDPTTAFAQLVAGGWTAVGLAEDLGGSGGDLRDAADVAAACAASGHRLPVADLLFVTARVLTLAGIPLPAGAVCVVAAGDRVPWASWATHFLSVIDNRVDLIEHAVVEPGTNLAGEPRDTVHLTGPVLASSPVDNVVDEIRTAGALARAVQLAAAIERVLAITVRYCAEREQFGRPIAAFQAVQQELAALAGESTAATAAVDHAIQNPTRHTVAVAKIRTGMAAGTAARLAHQVHGAIGITREYPLHRHTTALWSWRDEYGGEREWSAVLAADVIGHDPAWHGLAPA